MENADADADAARRDFPGDDGSSRRPPPPPPLLLHPRWQRAGDAGQSVCGRRGGGGQGGGDGAGGEEVAVETAARRAQDQNAPHLALRDLSTVRVECVRIARRRGGGGGARAPPLRAAPSSTKLYSLLLLTTHDDGCHLHHPVGREALPRPTPLWPSVPCHMVASPKPPTRCTGASTMSTSRALLRASNTCRRLGAAAPPPTAAAAAGSSASSSDWP